MKQLSGVQLLNVNGGDRIDFTWYEVDDETGDILSTNNKGNFIVTDAALGAHIEAIREHIRSKKLSQ